MSLLVRFLLLACIPFLVHAQITDEYKYQMDGTFNPDPTNIGATPVSFTLKWNEDEGRIRGVYSDNYYTSGSEAVGAAGPGGRSFNIPFPDTIRGANSIEVISLTAGVVTGSQSVTISPKNARGQPLAVFTVPVLMETDTTFVSGPLGANQETGPCVVGMGALAGYCGIYEGTITKERDARNRCGVLLSSRPRLELTPTGDFIMNFSDGDFRHVIGSLAGAGPLSPVVSVSSRKCDGITGTGFSRENCQDLNLIGTFSNVGGSRVFVGTYQIVDVENGERCNLKLNLEFKR